MAGEKCQVCGGSVRCAGCLTEMMKYSTILMNPGMYITGMLPQKCGI